MIDYNPLLFSRAYYFDKDRKLGQSIGSFEGMLIDKIRAKSPTPKLDETLLISRYISHVKVTDTAITIDKTRPESPFPVYEVHCKLLDNIKGKVIPSCGSQASFITSTVFPYTSSEQADSGDCFGFNYCSHWHALNNNGDITFKAGDEYIVFLDIAAACIDSNSIFCEIRPSGTPLPVFQVKNGFVENPHQFFGLSSSVPVAEFKQFVRDRINQIENY
jgi:hypothetical protein